MRRGRTAIIALVIGVLILLLLVEGFTTKTVGASSTGPSSSAQAPLAGAGPILTANGNGLKGIARGRNPGRRIALTFDDGPNPPYTTRIAAILRKDHVPATFFMVGSQVVRHPGVVKMLARDGFQIGNHTFTHANLTPLPGWERSLQISLNESAIAGITGNRPRLLRPPYSSTPDAVSPADEQAWAPLARRGYLIVLSNYDTEDWLQPGVDSIVRA